MFLNVHFFGIMLLACFNYAATSPLFTICQHKAESQDFIFFEEYICI